MMMLKYALLTMCVLPALSGCDSKNNATSQQLPAITTLATSTATPKPHNYEEKDGDVYMYVTAVSEEDTKKGIAAGDVVMYRYLGKQNNKFVLVGVNDAGGIIGRYECSEPCKIIKMNYDKVVSRMPYNTNTILGSAFEDAISGQLDISKALAKEPIALKDRGATSIPVVFTGEWNADLAACGTGLNDSVLRISPTKVAFYESEGEVRHVEVHTDRAITVQGTFAGEGESWTESLKMVLSDSRNDLTIDGSTRHRCPA